MFKYKDKVLNVVFYILMFIVLLAVFFAVYNFVSLRILKKNYTDFFGYTFFEVASGSMTGTIDIGDVIIVKINDDFKEDDIITYRVSDDFITHRVLKKEDNYVVTKGDSNNNVDNPVKYDMVVGRVVKIIRNVGVWQKVIMTPKVFISILITFMLFSIYFSKRGRDVNGQKKKQN